MNEDEMYMCVFACLIDEESLNFDITDFIQNLDIEYWQKELSVGNFKETLEGNKYKELGFFNNSLNRLIFYILLISETTKNLEYFENNKLDSDSYTEFLFCKLFDTFLSDIEFFQSVANISIGNKLICRIIKFYMNTDGDKAMLFGSITQKFYDVFIRQSTNKYSVVDTATVKVFYYFYLNEYND